MAQMSPQGQTVQVKPQPDIYSLLLIVSIIALGATIGVVLFNLMAVVPVGEGEPGGYGLTIGEFFKPFKELIGK